MAAVASTRATKAGALKAKTDAQGWRRRIGISLIAASVVAAALTILSSPASAKVISGAITGVAVTPTNPGIYDPLTVQTSWCVPDGSQAGDTFTLTLPPQLTPYTSGFPVKDAAGDVVANAVIANGVVTFTLTDFAQTHNNVCGTAFFNEAINQDDVVANQPNVLTFTSGSDVFHPTITPTRGTGTTRSTPAKYGHWVDLVDQGRTKPTDALYWFIETPVAPAAGYTTATIADSAGAGQAFDCSKVYVHTGTVDAVGNFQSSGRYTGTVTKTCSASALSVTTGAIAAGTLLQVGVPVTITDESLTKYGDTGQVSVDGAPLKSITAKNVVRYDAGGSASGTSSPITKPTSASASDTTASTAPTSASQSNTIVIAASSDEATVASTTLASTGFSSQRTGGIGVAFLLVGGLLLLMSGRRKRAASHR